MTKKGWATSLLLSDEQGAILLDRGSIEPMPIFMARIRQFTQEHGVEVEEEDRFSLHYPDRVGIWIRVSVKMMVPVNRDGVFRLQVSDRAEWGYVHAAGYRCVSISHDPADGYMSIKLWKQQEGEWKTERYTAFDSEVEGHPVVFSMMKEASVRGFIG